MVVLLTEETILTTMIIKNKQAKQRKMKQKIRQNQ